VSGNTEGNVPVTAAQQRALVRRGYDTVSLAYRNDDGRSGVDGLDHPGQYHAWVDELASVLLRPARVLDLGCGCGVPATSALVDRGLDVVGVDFSPIQVARAAGSSPRPRSSKPTWRFGSQIRRRSSTWPVEAQALHPGPIPYWAATVVVLLAAAAAVALIFRLVSRSRVGTFPRRPLGVDARARFATAGDLGRLL